MPKSKRSLNEGFAVIVHNGNKRGTKLLFVNGKQIAEDYAITYNHRQQTYTVTYIKAGMKVAKLYESLQDCVRDCEKCINKADKMMNEKCYKEMKEKGISFYNKLIKEYENGRSES